jgi:hypothetical protein
MLTHGTRSANRCVKMGAISCKNVAILSALLTEMPSDGIFV